jgi:hypothetical protein
VTTSAFDVQKDESVTPSEPDAGDRRLVDRLNPGMVNVLTVLGFGLPLIWYFWFVEHYSLNTLVGDQWSDVNVIKESYTNFFDWSSLWAQHFENRIFFPNLVVEVLAHTVQFNIRVEEFLGAVLLVVATVFLVWAHKRRSPSTPWLYYCPVAILTLSIVQYGNTIWGFQLAWYMVMLSLAATLLLLDRINLSWATLVGAVAVAAVGSFSSLQGLLIWPAGLVLLYYRRRSLSRVGVWIVAAIFAYLLYFYHYDDSQDLYPQYAREHLFASLKFFLFAIGDIVGKPVGLGTSNPDNVVVILFGLFIVVLALGTVLLCGLRRDEHSGSPLGVALICYGILFAALITQGRSFLGLGAASFSRYTTFDVLILVGIYLALLDCHVHAKSSHHAKAGRVPTVAETPASPRLRSLGSLRLTNRFALRCARVLLLMAILIQVPLGIHYGLQGARIQYVFNVKAANVLRNIHDDSNSQVRYYLYFLEPTSTVRAQARVLQEHHLSLFASG